MTISFNRAATRERISPGAGFDGNWAMTEWSVSTLLYSEEQMP